MLELTLTTGTELKIGEDIRIVFRGDTMNGRLKVAVEAPREKRIERVKAKSAEKQTERVEADAHRGYRNKDGLAVQRSAAGRYYGVSKGDSL